MKLLLTPKPSGPRAQRAFTLVEIVLSLAIIAIALVAIIGVMPIGLNVQAENQEESVISADAAIWMEAFRNGAQGMEYLAQNDSGGDDFYIDEVMVERVVRQISDGTPVSSNRTYLPNGAMPNFTSASNLIGILSRPKYQVVTNNQEVNWNVYADVRALNGNMADLGADMDFAFKYRMTPELVPLLAVTPDHMITTNAGPVPRPLPILATNLFELRLNFQWPLIVGVGGNYRAQTRFAKSLTFRTLVSGQQLIRTNEVTSDLLFFMSPRHYSYLTNPPPTTP